LSFCNIPIVNFSYDEKTQETQTAKQLKLKDDSVFATSVPLSDNTACAAFTSTPERAHQKFRSPTLLLQMFLRFQHQNMRLVECKFDKTT
jgi:hypothetical protein